MLQLWTTSKLGKLDYALRKELRFYAPLCDSMDFMGIDPAVYVRNYSVTRAGRDGLQHTVAANVPKFDYVGETPWGLYIFANDTLSFSPSNGLHDASTLIWFHETLPRSTPLNPNPFVSNGTYNGTADAHIKHLTKMNRVLSNAEINTIQAALGDVVQIIPPPIPPPTQVVGAFAKVTPAGTTNSVNTTFTLPSSPDLNSILIIAHGVVCERVASGPGALQYALSGTGSKTITMGLAPAAGTPFWSQYIVVAP